MSDEDVQYPQSADEGGKLLTFIEGVLRARPRAKPIHASSSLDLKDRLMLFSLHGLGDFRLEVKSHPGLTQPGHR